MPTDTLIRQATTANSYDAATRTFEAVIATMTPVLRSDAQGPFNEILDPATLGARSSPSCNCPRQAIQTPLPSELRTAV